MPEPVETCFKDGGAWPIAGQAQVDWINERTETGLSDRGCDPAAVCRLRDPDNPAEQGDLPRDLSLGRRQDLAFIDLLRRHSGDRRRWVGYLDTGASDIVFWDAPKGTLYRGWRYMFVLGGPDQAATWRPAPGGQPNWKSIELREVISPDDRSWLVAFLRDDDWACLGVRKRDQRSPQ